MPPYALPGSKTQTGIKTRSTLGGTPANFNEIRFEDKKGSEQLFIHAEKNQDIEVENDETHWVGHDRKKTIDNDETTLVKRDRTETVDTTTKPSPSTLPHRDGGTRTRRSRSIPTGPRR
jgi:type VI secretion system secreted protein VgrG